MASLSQEQLTVLTRLGAHARLAELVQEMDAILAAFPDLGALPARPKTGGGDGPGPLAKAARPRKKYRMSAANRKAVSERMSKYWAARREQKAAQEPANAGAPTARGRKRANRRGRRAR